MTPAEFVEKARADAARHLLGVTDHRIEQVAVKAGFGDTERLRRAFIRLGEKRARLTFRVTCALFQAGRVFTCVNRTWPLFQRFSNEFL